VADRLYTSSEADEILSALRFETKLEKVTLARMAFALSVAQIGKDVPSSPNFSGGEMKRPTFFADDEAFVRALLSYTYKKPDLSEDELFSNRALTKNHIDHGASLLNDLFQSCGRSGDGLISALVEKVEFSGRRENFGQGTGNIYWAHAVAAKRVGDGTEQHVATCQLTLGNHGQAWRRKDTISIKAAG
jgi:DNA sulfur modification protein DndE